MKIKPMISEYEVPGIQRIGTIDCRHLIEVSVPGLEGSYHQDLGSAPVAIRIEGTLAGDEARDDFLNELRDKFKAGDAIGFVADITTATEIAQVLISDLKVQEVAGSVDAFRYSITLRQFVEPSSTAPGADMGFADLTDLDLGLDLEAGDLFELMQLPDMLGSIPDIANPLPPIQGILEDFKSVTKDLPDTLGPLLDLFGTENG